MPVELFTDGIEPEDPDAVIWRFLKRWKFEDLIKSGQLHFCRADLFQDKSEGLPSDDYLYALGGHSLDLHKMQEVNHALGSMAQFRESFFLNCWYLFDEERSHMWRDYAADGVAICSHYSLLKATLEHCEGRPHLGLVRYGSEHLTGWNVQRFISTKEKRYSQEREVRAALWIMDPFAGGNRHFDINNKAHARPLTPPPTDRVPDGVRRNVDVQALITSIVLSPWSPPDAALTVETLVKDAGYTIPILPSELTRYKHLLP